LTGLFLQFPFALEPNATHAQLLCVFPRSTSPGSAALFGPHVFCSMRSPFALFHPVSLSSPLHVYKDVSRNFLSFPLLSGASRNLFFSCAIFPGMVPVRLPVLSFPPPDLSQGFRLPFGLSDDFRSIPFFSSLHVANPRRFQFEQESCSFLVLC